MLPSLANEPLSASPAPDPGQPDRWNRGSPNAPGAHWQGAQVALLIRPSARPRHLSMDYTGRWERSCKIRGLLHYLIHCDKRLEFGLGTQTPRLRANIPCGIIVELMAPSDRCNNKGGKGGQASCDHSHMRSQAISRFIIFQRATPVSLQGDLDLLSCLFRLPARLTSVGLRVRKYEESKHDKRGRVEV